MSTIPCVTIDPPLAQTGIYHLIHISPVHAFLKKYTIREEQTGPAKIRVITEVFPEISNLSQGQIKIKMLG